MSKWMRILGGVAVTGLFFWLALRNVNLAAVRDALGQASYGYLIPAALFCLAGYSVRAWRWGRILAPVKQIPFSRLFPTLIVGFATNNILPARVGELVRAYLLGREERISGSLTLATIVVERVCDGLVLLALMAVTLLAAPIPADEPSLHVVEIGAATIFGAATIVLLLLLLFPRPIVAITERCLRPLPRALGSRLERLLHAFIAGLDVLRSPAALGQIGALSLLVWLCEGGTYACAMLAFPLGLAPSSRLAATVFLLVFVNLGIMIPSAPGYIGTYQLFARLALSAFAVAESSALALSLVTHALQYSLVTGLGLLCLWRFGLSPRSIGRLAVLTPRPAIAAEPAD